MVNWLKKNYLYTAEYMSQMFGYLSCCLVTYIPTVAWKCTNIVTVMGIVTEVFVL